MRSFQLNSIQRGEWDEAKAEHLQDLIIFPRTWIGADHWKIFELITRKLRSIRAG